MPSHSSTAAKVRADVSGKKENAMTQKLLSDLIAVRGALARLKSRGVELPYEQWAAVESLEKSILVCLELPILSKDVESGRDA